MAQRKKTPQREWYRVDLHLHSPASVDFKQPQVTYLDFLKKAEERNLDVIAFTDHNTVAGYAKYLEQVESLEMLERLKRLRDDERKQLDEYRQLREKILILPGFEFTATLGFHILAIFPPETTVRELEHLLLSMHVPPEKLDQGSGEVGATTDALTAYRAISEAGGMAIAAHANSSHGVAMPGFDFGGQTRIAYTQDSNLLALEVTDLESKSRRRTALFFSGTKPEYPRRMHCIQGSDAHKLDFDSKFKNEMGVGDRATEILLDEVSFEAIKAVFVGNDFSRTRPYRSAAEEPFDPIREAREHGDTLIQAFHERLAEKRTISRVILQDIVALANTNGGTIYIGASADVRKPVVGVDSPERAITVLRAAISKGITPPLEVQVETLKSQGKNVLQVIVPRGSDVPYALEESYIFVRSENETGLAVRDEIMQLVRDALAMEFAATGTLASTPPAPSVTPAAATKMKTEEPPHGLIPPPRTGVEIVSAEPRKGVMYYSVRDLRNERIVHNVTLKSARRLWQYAISEREKGSCDQTKLEWSGNIAICKTYKRGGKVRYDMAQRVGDKLFVYYGVTDDGIHGVWRNLLEGITNGEVEEIPELPEVALEPEYDEVVGFGEPIPVLPELETFEDSSSSESEEGEDLAIEEPVQDREAFSDNESEELSASSLPVIELPPESVAPTLSGREVSISQPKELPHDAKEPTIPAKENPPAPAAPEPAAPKTRAQAWREQLERAMAEARASRDDPSQPKNQSGKTSSGG